MQQKCDECVQTLYPARERVSPGLYQHVESGHRVCLEDEDFLPASLDGHVSVYICVQNTWAQIQQGHKAVEGRV